MQPWGMPSPQMHLLPFTFYLLTVRYFLSPRCFVSRRSLSTSRHLLTRLLAVRISIFVNKHLHTGFQLLTPKE